jgi:hypothetical protein
VRLLDDVVKEEALTSRFLSRLGRKTPKSLTDIFRIWHGDSTRNDPIPAYICHPSLPARGPKAMRQGPKIAMSNMR